jgi:hypothetical protein
VLLRALAALQDVCRFDEDVARQYIAEVVLALEYVHSKVCGAIAPAGFSGSGSVSGCVVESGIWGLPLL